MIPMLPLVADCVSLKVLSMTFKVRLPARVENLHRILRGEGKGRIHDRAGACQFSHLDTPFFHRIPTVRRGVADRAVGEGEIAYTDAVDAFLRDRASDRDNGQRDSCDAVQVNGGAARDCDRIVADPRSTGVWVPVYSPSEPITLWPSCCATAGAPARIAPSRHPDICACHIRRLQNQGQRECQKL